MAKTPEGKPYNYQAHRFAWMLYVGEIPAGYEVDHLCKNTRCVAIDHLEPVTPQENRRRSTWAPVINAEKTHCPQGHRYDLLNTRIDARTGFRRCRSCQWHWNHSQPLNPRRLRLTEDDVRSIRAKRSDGVILRVLAQQYDVSIPTVQDVVARRTYAHVA